MSDLAVVAGARLPAQLLLDEAAILEEALEEGAGGPMGKRGDASAAEMNSLWFGPRLGRRRRSPPEEMMDMSAEEEAVRAEALVELLREAPWALIALKGTKYIQLAPPHCAQRCMRSTVEHPRSSGVFVK